jgi:hypothetical protein
MYLALFHIQSRRVFRGRRDEQSPYGHAFGGAADYRGLVPKAGWPPVHLLFRLHTADPGIGLSLPTSDWLPLLCAIRYGACEVGYRVVSDNEVRILSRDETEPWDVFPYDGYPERLPMRPVELVEEPYNPDSALDCLYYAGVFGYEHLSQEQFNRMVQRVEEDGLHAGTDWETAKEYVLKGNGLPFAQWPPADDCPDPACGNHGRKGSMRTLAIFEEGEAETRRLWGPDCGSLQIIYQVCPLCSAILTTNQCT